MECNATKSLAFRTTYLSLVSEQFKSVLVYVSMLVKGGTTLSYCKVVSECVTACQSSSERA